MQYTANDMYLTSFCSRFSASYVVSLTPLAIAILFYSKIYGEERERETPRTQKRWKKRNRRVNTILSCPVRDACRCECIARTSFHFSHKQATSSDKNNNNNRSHRSAEDLVLVSFLLLYIYGFSIVFLFISPFVVRVLTHYMAIYSIIPWMN